MRERERERERGNSVGLKCREGGREDELGKALRAQCVCESVSMWEGRGVQSWGKQKKGGVCVCVEGGTS